MKTVRFIRKFWAAEFEFQKQEKFENNNNF